MNDIRRKRILFFLTLSALLFCSFFFAAETKIVLKKHAPLVDLSAWTQEKGFWKDVCGNAKLIPGKTTGVCEGPLGNKAFYFDGRKTSVATLDLGTAAKKFDGFEYALSFWFRCDEIVDVQKDAIYAGNSPGFGLTLAEMGSGSFQQKGYSPLGGIRTRVDFNSEQWNHFALVFSVEKRINRVYINGFPVVNINGTDKFFPLIHPQNGKYTVGAFCGAIADLKMWDKAVDPDMFLKMELTPQIENMIRPQIAKILADCGSAPGAKIMCDSLTGELDGFVKAKIIPAEDFNLFQKRLFVAKKLVRAVNTFKESAMKDAPLAIIPIRAITDEQHTPLRFPQNPIYTDQLYTVNARDEYSSLSFFVYPYCDLKKIEFELEDLTGTKGGIIPKSEMELKLVQCWYQPGWNSYFNGHGSYNPGLLVNDPDLLRIDERNKINYLRFFYPSGTEYHNICEPGSVLKEDPFQFAFEPVWDADTLQPVPCVFGRNRQFWLDIHAPENAKADVYKGRIKVKADGKDAGHFYVVMRVLPFELPFPKTQFDRKLPFIQGLSSASQIAGLTEIYKDEKIATEWVRRHIENQKKHGILSLIFHLDAEDPEPFRKTVKMMKEAKLPMIFVDAGNGQQADYGMASRQEQLPLDQVATKERVEKDLAQYAKKVQRIKKIALEEFGTVDNVYFYGIDEATGINQFRMMMPFRDIFFREGMKIHSSGWEQPYDLAPSHEWFHSTAAYVDRGNADRWHYIKGEITAYCVPFIGPDNPHLMRTSHGLRMFRSNYNGWWELAYDGGSTYHTWNHLFGYDTTYRPFRFIVHVAKGPIINTIAFSGMREGQNDVRYATLLHLLADECFASDDIELVVEARKSLAWFRDLPYPLPVGHGEEMYVIREKMTHHILKLMKLLGKKMD